MKKEIIFPSREAFLSLPKFHKEGGELKEGIAILLERNARTELIESKLVSWEIGEVAFDLTGYGKYSKSYCMVQFKDRIARWPFSMIYTNKPSIKMETTVDKSSNLSAIKALFEAGEKLTVITCYKKVSTLELRHYVAILRNKGLKITDKWMANSRKRWKVYWLEKEAA